jgi:hypothetical protein
MELLFWVIFTYCCPILLTINIFWMSLLDWICVIAIPCVHVGLYDIGIHMCETFEADWRCMPWGIGLYHLVHCAITILTELYRKVSAQCKASCQGDTQHKHTQNWDCDSSHAVSVSPHILGLPKETDGFDIKEKTFF